jgi:hypothetical protein
MHEARRLFAVALNAVVSQIFIFRKGKDDITSFSH